jgi:hypothetical protein
MAMYNIAYLFTIYVAAQFNLWVLDASRKMLLLGSWNKKINHDLGCLPWSNIMFCQANFVWGLIL